MNKFTKENYENIQKRFEAETGIVLKQEHFSGKRIKSAKVIIAICICLTLACAGVFATDGGQVLIQKLFFQKPVESETISFGYEESRPIAIAATSSGEADEANAAEPANAASVIDKNNKTGEADVNGETDMAGETNKTGEPDMTGDTNKTGEPDMTGDTNKTGEPDMTGDTNKTGETDMTGDTNKTGVADENEGTPLRTTPGHKGIDIVCDKGTPVNPVLGGTVTETGYNAGYGNYIVIQHEEEYTSKYAHLDSILVEAGQEVGPRTRIGTVGSTGMSTGPHLHLEMTRNGELIDPSPYIFGNE